MSNIQIRKAVKGDCKQLMELIHELAEFEKAPEQVTVDVEYLEKSGFGENPVWWALVAEDKETKTVVGLALYYIRYSTWKGQQLYLEDLIVSQEWRGRGIGTQLFNGLIKEVKERNFKGMTWQVLEWNEPAKAFYKKYNAAFDPEWINCIIESQFLCFNN